VTTATQLTAALKALIPANVAVYVGDVPGRLPDGRPAPPPKAEPGTKRVYPYAVIYPGVGVWPQAEASTLDGEPDGDALDWPVQITVASGDPDWTLEATDAVERAVLGKRLVNGGGRLWHPPGEEVVLMDRDEDLTPNRWFVPLRYRYVT
jgi:hypothetical protein